MLSTRRLLSGTERSIRLRNLVIDSVSLNAAKQNVDFADKLEDLSNNSTFLSRGELIDFADLTNKDNPKWTVESVKERQRHLVQFAREQWKPETWYKKSKHVSAVSEDEPSDTEQMDEVIEGE